MTRSLARELGDTGATVNAFVPGSIHSGISRHSIRAGQAKEIIAGQALHRCLQPADLVGGAHFLASDAARAITGQTIVVDGGTKFL